MKVGLIGYGKMGRLVEALASSVAEPHEADILIDFSHPDAVIKHLEMAIELKKNLVIGTTGWYDQLDQVQTMVEKAGIGVVYGPNFSIGVYLMGELVKRAHELMEKFPEYDIAGVEYHHKHKVDSPSGTALSLGVPFSSVRVGSLFGTHTVLFDSPEDTLEVTHRAKGREGFAKGALKAAEWILGKKGFYHFDHYLKDQLS
ncbi:MAG: 4-hydroxy-tetrahydrodipicolinate reductase [Chlamydiia bacterium]|nr:4-hydroxy-tetrahydrodipicolinate reductase [Chlamydiia bacterium]MCH9615471.1 4-hydroxy-tetrahydrodipicolinate reductase [Chlamydiia bacterium]MCH9629126.1 4-hydroxy-tetrahydrodipicolinate reductase [Chlamydiia bacterium]